MGPNIGLENAIKKTLHTGGNTDGWRNREKDRHTDKQTTDIRTTDTQTDKQKDRHTERKTDKETGAQIYGNMDVRTAGHTYDETISSLTSTECSELK
ncbi:hypothetical protein DPMN_087637 [Dreissena polymorpha]|uniref:Uncharacterized protein n=1 Tax=Dreissena polymorpha TaxID=45954 RepID=A0A9D4QWJ6_DREPO|nr:hypothetical protein DPMN_087637 [Dreissena polymorpha]